MDNAIDTQSEMKSMEMRLQSEMKSMEMRLLEAIKINTKENTTGQDLSSPVIPAWRSGIHCLVSKVKKHKGNDNERTAVVVLLSKLDRYKWD